MSTSNSHSDFSRSVFRLRAILPAAAVLFLIAALIAPIWIVTFPPLLDYPNHLARAFVLSHLRDPAFTFAKFYRADWGPYPYLGMDASLAVLSRAFPIEIAGQIFLSLCVLALPAAAWFFLRQINLDKLAATKGRSEELTALWTLLLAFNVFVLEGFLNFALSIAVVLVTITLWLRWLAHASKPGEDIEAYRPKSVLLDTRIARWLVALAAFTALYFTHLLGFAIAGVMVIAYLALSRRPLRDWLWSGSLALPGVFLYLHSSRVGIGVRAVEFHGFAEKIKSLSAIMHGYSSALDAVSIASLAAWFFLAWWRNPEFRWNATWLKISGLLLILYFAIPWMWGEGSDLDIRVLPILFVTILASARVGRRGRWLAAIPLILFGARTINLSQHFVAAQTELSGLAKSFEIVPRDALVFPIVEGDQDPIERPFTHFWAYGVIRHGWFSPYLADEPGQTPMRIIYDSYTSDGFWDEVYTEPPDWVQVQRDYDYIWAYAVPRYSAALAGIGDNVYSYGALQVYRVRKPPGSMNGEDPAADSGAH